MDHGDRESVEEPIKKSVGGDLSKVPTFQRLEMLKQNADALLGESWRGKDDGTFIRKTVGASRRPQD